jgi:CubicO group peptidase (beta-lactamase class C family)
MKMHTLLLSAALILFSHFAFADNTALLKEIVKKAKISASDSLMIVQDGKVVYSDFFGGTDQVRNVQSVTKSVCGLALGILLEEGKLKSFDVPLSQWIPSWTADPVKSQITLRMIMNHTSGYPDVETLPEFFKNGDLVTEAIKVSLITAPGERFHYSSIATTLLQKVISQTSGQSVENYVNERILFPLGITEAKWKRDQAGNERVSGGLSLSTAGLLKLGTLILNEGRFENKTIIGSQTLQTLLTKSQPFEPYGLLWWLAPSFGSKTAEQNDLVSAAGWGGQFVTVYPEKHLIAVRTKDPMTVDENQYEQQNFHEFIGLISKWQ